MPNSFFTFSRMRSPSSSPGPRKESFEERLALSKLALKIKGNFSLFIIAESAAAHCMVCSSLSITQGPEIISNGFSLPTVIFLMVTVFVFTITPLTTRFDQQSSFVTLEYAFQHHMDLFLEQDQKEGTIQTAYHPNKDAESATAQNVSPYCHTKRCQYQTDVGRLYVFCLCLTFVQFLASAAKYQVATNRS